MNSKPQDDSITRGLLSGESLPEQIKTGTFLLVGSGETYFTEAVKGRELLRRIMAAISGDDEREWDEDEVAFWYAQIGDLDNWSHGDYGTHGPVNYRTDIGETDHLELVRMTQLPESA